MHAPCTIPISARHSYRHVQATATESGNRPRKTRGDVVLRVFNGYVSKALSRLAENTDASLLVVGTDRS
jgi:hypothetical protein